MSCCYGSCRTDGFRTDGLVCVDMEMGTTMTGVFPPSLAGNCVRGSDSSDIDIPVVSDADETGCLRLRWWKSVPPLFFFWLAIGILGSQARAQVSDRTLSGTVKSSSGAPIANAQVLLKETANGETKSVMSNTEGSFTFNHLSPGTYEITASKQGFADIHANITISADANAVVDLVMQPGNALPPGKGQTGSPTVSGVVNSTSISDLPLNGRSASDVATLEPGVATARTQTSGQAQRGFGTEMTISGSRPRQNDSRLDGISMNDYSNGPPGSALGVNLGVDAVEQFSVLTSNYPAQYGRSSGGIISASTRSGTNDFHGAVYEFFRNSALDARNFFDTKKPPFHRNQFGASLNGPIIKGRTFIFGDYEGLRSSLGVTQVDTVPSPAALAGNLSTGHIQVDPTVL